MKKLTLFLAIALVVSLTSCRKNRSCNCITSISGVVKNDTQEDVIVKDVTKDEAIQACEDLNFTTSFEGVTTKYECTSN